MGGLKQIFFFLLVNGLILVTISVILSVLGVRLFLTAHGAGREKMVNALEALKRVSNVVDPTPQPTVQTLIISGRGSRMFRLFSMLPPSEKRVKRLMQGRTAG